MVDHVKVPCVDPEYPDTLECFCAGLTSFLVHCFSSCPDRDLLHNGYYVMLLNLEFNMLCWPGIRMHFKVHFLILFSFNVDCWLHQFEIITMLYSGNNSIFKF